MEKMPWAFPASNVRSRPGPSGRRSREISSKKDPGTSRSTVASTPSSPATRKRRVTRSARNAVWRTRPLRERSISSFSGQPSRSSAASASTSATRSVAWLKALPSVAIHAISAECSSRSS